MKNNFILYGIVVYLTLSLSGVNVALANLIITGGSGGLTITGGGDNLIIQGDGGPAVSLQNLIAYWKLDETSGTTVTDSAGSYNLTINGNVGISRDGILKNSYIFDGSGDYANAATNLGLGGSSSFSVSLWAKHLGGPNNWEGLFQIGTSGGDDLINIQYNNTKEGYLHLSRKETGTLSKISSAPFNILQWNNIIVTVNGSTDAITMYVNGSAVTADDSGDAYFAGGASADTTTIGDAKGSGGSYANGFNGLIDEVKVYNYEITSGDVSTLYKEGWQNIDGESGEAQDASLALNLALDETSGTTVTDTSTNANNGTNDGATVNQTGVFGGAYSFDGTNDKVTVTSSAALSPTSAITVATWVKINSAPGTNYTAIVSKTRSTDPYGGYLLNTQPSQKFSFQVNVGGTWVNSLVSNTAYVTGEWYYVVGTFDGSYIKLYVNGSLEGKVSSSGSIQYAEASNLLIANSGDVPSGYLNATIDNVRIYSKALTADEVWDQARRGLDGIGLVGHWTMDETSGSYAYDYSGNNNDGTITGATVNQTGQVDKAYSFDGNDYIDAGDPGDGSFDFGTGDFSVSVWAYRTASGSRYYMVNKFYDTGSWQPGYGIAWSSDDTVVWYISASGSGTGQYTAAAVSANAWHHFVLTRKSGTAYFYIDGVLNNQLAANYNVNSTYNLNIGRNSGGSNYYFQGYVDEARLYNRTLSAKEILAMSLEQPRVKWDFEEVSGTRVYDSATNKLNGTLEVGATVNQTGKMGLSYSFDGSGDRLNMPDSAALTFAGDFSFSVWVKLDSSFGDTYRTVISTDDGNSTAFFRVYARKDITAWELIDPAAVGWKQYTDTIPLNQWVHVVVVRSGSSMSMYRDTSSLSDYDSSSWDPTEEVNPSSEGYNVGANWNDTGQIWYGNIDDMRFYGNALNATQITYLYDRAL